MSGIVEEKAAYQEWETEELLTKPLAGLYYLTFNEREIPTIISRYSTENWLERMSQRRDEIVFLPPYLKNGCASAIAGLHWFTDKYQQIGQKIIASASDNIIKLTHESPPQGAAFFSVSALIVEYQLGVRVEYVHRLSMPFDAHLENKH